MITPETRGEAAADHSWRRPATTAALPRWSSDSTGLAPAPATSYPEVAAIGVHGWVQVHARMADARPHRGEAHREQSVHPAQRPNCLAYLKGKKQLRHLAVHRVLRQGF